MRPCIYLVLIVTLTCSVMHCSGVRTSATRIQTARTRRLDEIDQ